MPRPKAEHTDERAEKLVAESEDIEALSAVWRSVASAPAEDEDAQRTCRQVLAKIRKLTSKGNCKAIHPDEPMIDMYVPLPVGTGSTDPFTIRNGKGAQRFKGQVVVPRCVAQTLASMIYENRRVDADRMKDRGRIVDLDNPIASRARAIQQAE